MPSKVATLAEDLAFHLKKCHTEEETPKEEDEKTEEELLNGPWELYEEKYPEAKKRFEEAVEKNKIPVTKDGKTELTMCQWTYCELVEDEHCKRWEDMKERQKKAEEKKQKLEIDELESDFARASCSQP
jgi:hypothetical protein